MSDAIETHVWLLIENSRTILGVYAHKSDALADSEAMGGRYRVERWKVDFETVAVDPEVAA